MTTITDRKWKPFKYRYEVPDRVLQSQFDHLNEDEMDGFLRYRRRWYHLTDFMHSNIEGWHGQHTDSFYSAVLIEISRDGEEYRIGTYIV
jgi:hypothetical protein